MKQPKDKREQRQRDSTLWKRIEHEGSKVDNTFSFLTFTFFLALIFCLYLSMRAIRKLPLKRQGRKESEKGKEVDKAREKEKKGTEKMEKRGR